MLLENPELETVDELDFRPVPKDKWLPELEQRVKEYMAISPDLPHNDIIHKHIVIPEFKTPEERRKFWYEQIRRCKEGYNGMCGKMYFYYNFCCIEKIGSGKIKPDFRVIDNEWFKFIESAQKSREWGVICVKRRRVGASWKEVADVLHDCLLNKNFHVGMNSKSELDSQFLFIKVKFVLNNLPSELRVAVLSETKSFIHFAEYDKESNRYFGNQSDIITRAPVNQAFEGASLDKWVCDEAGKIDNLEQMWAYTEPTMRPETRRIGCPIIFGTSGDVGKDGLGLMKMWDNHDVYKLRRFFFAGWMGLASDEKGNDNKEETIRWIVYERRRLEKLDTKFYNDFIQQYPLTVEEAFSNTAQFGMGDPIKLKAQRQGLILNPVAASRGKFEERDNKIVFVADRLGHCIVYEHPDVSHKQEYVAGCDPADIDDVFEEASDLSTYILALQDGTKRPRIVFEYTDRPRELNNYYHQMLLALRYFNDTKVLIERQKGGRLISYISDQGYKYLLMTQPQEVQRLYSTRNNSIGIHMNEFAKDYMRGVVSEYVDNFYEVIPSIPLIDELLSFGTKNTDKAMAFGITIIALKETAKPYLKKTGNRDSRLPKYKYVKQNGKIKLVR